MTMLGALVKGPAAYVPRTGWPAWAVLPAAAGDLCARRSARGRRRAGQRRARGGLLPPPGEHAPQMMLQLAAWIAGLQIGIIGLTLLAAGFFSSKRADVLALEPPAGGWGVLPAGAAAAVRRRRACGPRPAAAAADGRLPGPAPVPGALESDAVWVDPARDLPRRAPVGGAAVSRVPVLRARQVAAGARRHRHPDDAAVDGAARGLLGLRPHRGAGHRPLFLLAAGAHRQPVGHDLLPCRLQYGGGAEPAAGDAAGRRPEPPA